MPDEGKNKVGIEAKIGVDVVGVKAGAVETQLRPNVDTGATDGTGGIEVKAGGFDISVGKKMGVSMPFDEVAVNTDDCVIQ